MVDACLLWQHAASLLMQLLFQKKNVASASYPQFFFLFRGEIEFGARPKPRTEILAMGKKSRLKNRLSWVFYFSVFWEVSHSEIDFYWPFFRRSKGLGSVQSDKQAGSQASERSAYFSSISTRKKGKNLTEHFGFSQAQYPSTCVFELHEMSGSTDFEAPFSKMYGRERREKRKEEEGEGEKKEQYNSTHKKLASDNLRWV